MTSAAPPLLSLDALVPDSKLLEAARRLVGFGAFTQADIGAVACRGASSKASRGVLAQRLRERMEDAGWIEPFQSPDASGLPLMDTREGSRVFKLSTLARQELSRMVAKDAGQYAEYTRHLNRTLAECPPPELMPRKGVLLANRWLHANALRLDGIDGVRCLAVGEYALRGELRFANPKPGWDGYEIKNVVDRMPDGLMLELRHEVDERRSRTVELEGLTLVEIERRFEDAAKHFRLFLHFDANGELRPLYSEVFRGLGAPTGDGAHETAVVRPSRIQVVRAVERATAPPRKHKNAGATSGEAVTASYLLELAKVFFFGTTLIPKHLRSDRTERIAKELHRSGILERRSFVTSPTEASIHRFRWMLQRIEVVTVEVHGRHGTLTEACVQANGALRPSIKLVSLQEYFDEQYGSLDKSQPTLKPAEVPSPTSAATVAQPQKPDAADNDVPANVRELVRRIVRSQVEKVAKAGLDGSDAWHKLSASSLDSLAEALGPVMVREGPHDVRQPEAACAAHAWLTNSDEDPSDASLEIGYRCVYVFDLDMHREV